MVEFQTTVCNGKYKYIFNKDGSSSVLRYGNIWRDTTGDSFILSLAQRRRELENGEDFDSLMRRAMDKASEEGWDVTVSVKAK